jgi:hypothetical protein
MKRVIVALMISAVGSGFCITAADADEEVKVGWESELVATLNLTQAGFDNWAQGGENMLGWQTGVNGNFTHRGLGHEWENTAKLAYGMQKLGDEEARKSVDEIKLGTVYIYKAGFFVDPYASATAQTQFTRGYEYDDSERTSVSDFLDPGYFTQSVGVGRSYGDILRSRLGFAVKETITDEFPVPYADDPETEDEIEDTRVETGMESITDLTLSLSESLLLTSKLELFSNMEASNEIDVTWDNLVTAKVHEYVSVSLNVQLLYDRDVSTKRQLKESLALGLTYTLM